MSKIFFHGGEKLLGGIPPQRPLVTGLLASSKSSYNTNCV